MSKSKLKNRTSDPASDETDDSNQASSSTKFDLSCLRQPVMTSVTGFEEVLRAYEAGTDELRKLLSRECDLIYECKVCRNIFRSLTNFISHKRVYCRTTFNASEHFHFRQNGYQTQDISTIVEAEQACNANPNGMLPGPEDKSKDLSGIVERLLWKQHQSRNANLNDFYGEIHDSTAALKSHTLKLDRVNDSGIAVYQSLQVNNDNSSIRDEVAEVHRMLTKSNTVLGPDGKLLNLFASTTPNGHSAKDSKTCQVCFETFDTKKTLKLHLELKHLPSTYLYQCPSCPQKFSSSAAVMKHLSNDHKKNLRRIRLMRDNIIKKRVRADEVTKKLPSRELQKLAMNNGSEGGQEDSETSWNTNDLSGEYQNDSYTCPSCFKKFERKTVYTNHVLACSEAKCRENIKLKKQKAKEEAKIKEAEDTATAVIAQQQPELPPQEPTKRKRKRAVKPKKEVAEEVPVKAEENSSLVDWNLDDEEEKKKLENIKKEIIEDDYKRASTSINVSDNVAKEIESSQNNSALQMKIEDDDDDDEESALVIDEKGSNDNDTSDTNNLKCPQCEKMFDNQDKLKYHTTTFHSRQKRFKCKMCEYQGYRKKDTMNHLNYVHNIECDKEKLESLMESVMRALDEESLAKQNELKRHQLKIKRRMERAKKRESKIQGDGSKSTDASTSSKIPAPQDDSPETALKLLFEPPPLVPIGSSAESKQESEFKYPPVIVSPPVANREPSVPAKLRRKSLHTSVLIPPENDKYEGPGSPLKIPKMFIKAAPTSSSDESPDNSEKKKKKRNSRGSTNDQVRPGQSLLDISKFGKVVKRSSNGEGKEAQRPIRNRIKPVNKDFLYDLSDLLKKDADAYREHQVTQSTTVNVKRELRKRAMSTNTRETPGLSSFDESMSPKKNTLPNLSPFKSPNKDEDDIPLMKIKEKHRRMSVFQPPTRPIFSSMTENTSEYSRSNSSNPHTGAAYKMALKEFTANSASLYEPKFQWTICFDQNKRSSMGLPRYNGGGSQISAASSILQRLSGKMESPIAKKEPMTFPSTPESTEPVEENVLKAPKSKETGLGQNGLIALALGSGENVCVLQECDPDSDEDDDSEKPSSSDIDLKKTSKASKRPSDGNTKSSKKSRKNSEKRKSGTNGQRRLTVMQRLQENKIRKTREQLFQRLIRDRQSTNDEDDDDDDEMEGVDQSSPPYNLFSES